MAEHPGEVAPGWAAFTVRGPAEELLALLAELLGGAVEQDGGRLGYRRSWKLGSRGSLFASNPQTADPKRVLECWVSLTGEECLALGWEGLTRLHRGLAGRELHYTRFDVSWDDAARSVLPRQVWEAFKSGQVVTRLDVDGDGNGWQENGAGGSTCYLGSPQSEQRLRVYDKDRQQKVPLGTYGIRWELQARKGRAERAHTLACLLLEADSDQERARVYVGHLVAHVDFRDRQAGKAHGERAERSSWYRAIVGRMTGAIRTAQRLSYPTVERKLRWVRDQVAPSLAVLMRWAGGDLGWLMAELQAGEARVKDAMWLQLPVEARPYWYAGV